VKVFFKKTLFSCTKSNQNYISDLDIQDHLLIKVIQNSIFQLFNMSELSVLFFPWIWKNSVHKQQNFNKIWQSKQTLDHDSQCHLKVKVKLE
jgi:hypothetical protein